ncbi:MAG: alpha/beta hydrolase [Proteobacteria bacterium]|nr:alpha/beta hydrolase [Pseudomonadota bacterium]
MRDWYAGTRTHTMGELHTQVRDDGTGEPVVCLHGFPTSSWDFEPVWPALIARHRGIALDFVGMGRASKPDQPISISLQADLVESVLVERGVEQVHVFAHDYGDTVAQELLARQATGAGRIRLRSVLFLNGGLFPETHRPRLIQRLLISPLGRMVAQLSTERTFRRNMTRIFGPETPPSDAFLADSWQLLIEAGGKAALPRLIRYMAERREQRERWVQPIIDQQVPTMFLNGSLDPVSGRHAADRYGELAPGAALEHLDRLGHYPHVEDPERVIDRVLAFFGKR